MSTATQIQYYKRGPWLYKYTNNTLYIYSGFPGYPIGWYREHESWFLEYKNKGELQEITESDAMLELL